jgi:hypothetical protein
MDEVAKSENKQIEMPIKEKGESIYGIKRKISKKILYAGILPQWRNFMFVFSTVSGLALTLIISVFLYLNIGKLPDEVPLIFQQSTKTWLGIPKNNLFIIPLILFVYLLLITNLKGRIYSFDRRLVIVMNIAEIISYIFLLIALTQLFSLLLT